LDALLAPLWAIGQKRLAGGALHLHFHLLMSATRFEQFLLIRDDEARWPRNSGLCGSNGKPNPH